MKRDTTIEFPVIVDGVRLIANVVEQNGRTGKFRIRVKFDDGFEDLFTLYDDHTEGAKPNSASYAKALHKDISNLIGLDLKKFYHVFQELIEGELINIWVMEQETRAGRITYTVYYHSSYRFELVRKTTKWLAFTRSKIYPEIDLELAKRIAYILVVYFRLMDE